MAPNVVGVRPRARPTGHRPPRKGRWSPFWRSCEADAGLRRGKIAVWTKIPARSHEDRRLRIRRNAPPNQHEQQKNITGGSSRTHRSGLAGTTRSVWSAPPFA